MEMAENVKNFWEICISGLTLLGGGIAFGFSLHQWKRGHAFQKAQKLDEFIAKFESDQLLRLAATILDWRIRTITVQGQEVLVTSKEVLLALRRHDEIKNDPQFPGQRMLFRDAYDALLNFLQRLEIAISGNLVDPVHAKKGFEYWIERMLKMDRHADDPKEPFLNGRQPAELMLRYIEAYGDLASFKRLCRVFGVRGIAGL